MVPDCSSDKEGHGSSPGSELLAHAVAEPRSSIEQVLGGEIDTLAEIIDCVERGAHDARIKAVYLKMGDIDAGWARAQELRSALRDFSSAGKPVIAHLEVGGNKEYYIASGADK